MPDPREAVYAQIQRRMLTSGEWDRIANVLAAKLNESGWIDSLHDSSKEMARANSTITVTRLIEELGSQSTSSIPPKVKEEIIQMIRHYLDTQLDK